MDQNKPSPPTWLHLPEDVKIKIFSGLGVIERLRISSISMHDFMYTVKARCKIEKIRIYQKDDELRIGFWGSPKDGDIRVAEFNNGVLVTYIYGRRERKRQIIDFWSADGFYKEYFEENTSKEEVFSRILRRTFRFVDTEAVHICVPTLPDKTLANLTIRLNGKLLADTRNLPLVENFLICRQSDIDKLDIQIFEESVENSDEVHQILEFFSMKSFDVGKLKSVNIHCPNDFDDELLSKLVNAVFIDIRRSKISNNGILDLFQKRMHPDGLFCRYDVAEGITELVTLLCNKFKQIMDFPPGLGAIFRNLNVSPIAIGRLCSFDDEQRELCFIQVPNENLRLYVGMDKTIIESEDFGIETDCDCDRYGKDGPWNDEGVNCYFKRC